LSGGERARVLIAQLMLQPADVLLLDEPTNDLDIPTLEILEESLLEYRGALVLVTHDRYMLDRVSTVVLGLDGLGTAERFADFQQWEQWLAERHSKRDTTAREARRQSAGNGSATWAATSTPASKSGAGKKKLSYIEMREYETMEQRIADAELDLQVKHDALHDPAIMSDGTRLHAASLQMESAQEMIDDLYARWAELEEKQK
jgi:ATP-binding cassette subfamily F protein uup